MWWFFAVALLAVVLGVYVGVRQRRHPVSPGRHSQKHGASDPDSRDWFANEGGGLG